MKKVLVLVGPTAVGKTAFSIELAKRFNGEIISGDSIQVYRGLDIGSGKITEAENRVCRITISTRGIRKKKRASRISSGKPAQQLKRSVPGASCR